jgi:hypothetical protein
MNTRWAIAGLLTLIAMPSQGCISLQLQKLTNNHAKTFADVYEKQVLDNLAVFVVNPNATPFFSVPGQSQNSAGSKGNLNFGGDDNILKTIGLSGEGSHLLSSTMNPVTDANRLRLMQCAYQRAVGAAEQACQECSEIEADWFGPSNPLNGECTITCGWLRTSINWRDVPKCCRNKYGKHCGTYTWVDPCQSEEFSRLVMLIIEYATGDKNVSQSPSTTIQYYLNPDNTLGSVNDHSAVVTTVGADASSLRQLRDDLGITRAQIDETERQLGAINKLLAEAKDPSINLPELNLKMQSAKLFPGRKSLLDGDEEYSDPLAAKNALEIKKTELEAMKQQLELDQNPLEPVQRAPRNFGLPTQYNSIFGGGILQLRQQLDAGRLGR